MSALRASWGVRALVLGLFILVVGAFTALRVQAGPPQIIDVTVRSPGGSEADTIDLAGMSYADAVAAFDAAIGSTGTATLPVAPAGFLSVSAADAELYYGDAGDSLAIRGNTTLLGMSVEMLVTAVWDDPAGTPETAVLFSFGATSLSDFTDFDDFPVQLTGSWVGISMSSHAVDPADLPAEVADFFDDGLSGTEDAFDVSSDGVAFRGVLASTDEVIREAAAQLGLSGDIRIDGTLSSNIAAITGGGATTLTAGLDLTATLPTATGGSLPPWFTPSAAWSLHFAADAGGSVAVDLSGGADVTIGEDTYSVTASVGFAYDGAAATFSLTADLAPIDDLFGQAWLDLEGVGVNASFSTHGGFSGGIEATFDLEDLTGQTGATADVALEFAAGSDGAEGSLEVTTTVGASLADVATALGADPPDEFNLSMNGFALFIGFESGGSETSLTVALTTNLVIDVHPGSTNPASISSDVLLRLTSDSTGINFLFGVKPAEDASDVTVGQLLNASFGDADITLPRFTITISNTAWDVAAGDLDGPTAAYLGAGEDLSVDAGVVITSEVTIPPQLQSALSQIGIATEGDLVLTGKLPVFGGEELGIEIAFPTIVGSPDQPFRGGNLALVFKKEGTDFEMGIEGDATIGVPRTEDPACAAPYAGACTDELTFEVSATITVGASVGFELEGGLVANAGGSGSWDAPFGMEGLEIFELRIQIGVVATPPELTLGMLGRLRVNDTDVTVSFLLGVTPTPPFIDPKGFTFATNGFSLLDLAELERMVTGEPVNVSALPSDLRVENVFVAFGRVDEPSLCIRSGFFLTAELHMGGELEVSTEPPACEAPPVDPPQVTAECEADETCLASILLDIDTGVATGTPSFKAAGFFAATDLGPLHFDPTRIELELSASTQRLFVSGGASLDDPFDTSGDPTEWASGSFLLDFSSTQLKFVAEMNLAEGEALHVKATGIGVLSLSDPQFVVELEFRSDVLDQFADEVATGFNQFVDDVNDFAARLADARSDSPNLWANLLFIMQEDGTQPQWLVDLVSAFADIEATIGGINQTFTDAGLPPPFIGKAIQDIALQGITIGGFPGVPAPTLSGTHCVLPDLIFGGCIIEVTIDPPQCLGFVSLPSGCWYIPPGDPWHIPGLCDDPGFAGDMHDALCVDLTKTGVVNDLFEDRLEDQGLTLPPGTTGIEVLDTLDPMFTGGGISATCGFAVANYATHSISETELTMVIAGKPVVFDTPLDLVHGTFDPDNQSLQQAFEALLGVGDPTAGKCSTSSVPTDTVNPTVTVEVAPAAINEGGSVTASGVAEVTGIGSVDIEWGDGKSSSATVGAGGAFSAVHIYDDDGGPGTSTTYTIEARAGTAAASDQVTVSNVAPVVSAAMTSSAIDEGGSASVNVTFTDPGADSHLAEAVWSDGVRQTAALAVGARSHTFTRPVEDDNPTATPSDTLSVSITVRDDDGGSGSGGATLTVNNVAPSDVTLTPVEVLVGSPETFDGAGNLIVNEGDVVVWEVGFSDVGVRDVATVTIDWADGSETETHVVPANGLQERSFRVTHYYADDNPTGTASDAYHVQLSVTDDDTGVATDEAAITVHDLAPVITSVASSDNAPDEEEQVTLTIDFDDPGLQDTASVVVDWRDGTVDTYSIGAPLPPTIGRSLTASHTYDDDDPTGTPHDIHVVKVTVTDDDTLHDEETIDLDVTNVVPVIESLTVSSVEHDENETDVTLDLDFSDVSVMDSHTVTIDWGEGWSAGESADTTVGDEDARTTVVQIAAPGHGASAAAIAGQRHVTASNRYGDNGVYTITVTVVDDDTGEAVGSWDLSVINVNPTHAINDGAGDGGITTAGGQTFIARAGEDVTITDTANDPGSDDLAYDWLFGDGGGVLNTWLADVPVARQIDPALSPQVAPRIDVTDSITHAYAGSCLYGVSVHVTDDDGGDGGTDYVAVVIQANGDGVVRNHGQWNAAIQEGTLLPDQLHCFLDIAGYLSSVFLGSSELAGVPWAPANGYVDATVLNEHGVPQVLFTPPGSGGSKLANEQIKLDRALLSAWMNFANGVWSWDSAVEGGTTFGTVMQQVEDVRNHSTDWKALQNAGKRLNSLGGAE